MPPGRSHLSSLLVLAQDSYLVWLTSFPCRLQTRWNGPSQILYACDLVLLLPVKRRMEQFVIILLEVFQQRQQDQ